MNGDIDEARYEKARITEEVRTAAIDMGIERHLRLMKNGFYEKIGDERPFEIALQHQVQNCLAELMMKETFPYLKLKHILEEDTDGLLITSIEYKAFRLGVKCRLNKNGIMSVYPFDKKTHRVIGHLFDNYVSTEIRKPFMEAEWLYFIGFIPTSEVLAYARASAEESSEGRRSRDTCI